MRSRKKYWRDAAYDYIKENGPKTSEQLLSGMVTAKGKLWRNSKRGPQHPNAASQLLKSDKRFCCEWTNKSVVTGVGSTATGTPSRSRTYASYKVREWRIVDEKSQTDTE